MNDIIKSLYGRKSTRAFTDRPISEDIKREIYAAACQAPTAGNQQLYAIIDVTNMDVKKRLSVLCDNQPMIARAPMVSVFLADQKRWCDSYKEAGLTPRQPLSGDLMLAVTDTAIAAQNAVVAAESLGIGSCYIGDVMENSESMRELLSLPEYVFPCCMLIFGYPAPSQVSRRKPERLKLEHIVHRDKYVPATGGQLRRMLTEQQTRESGKPFDYDVWMKAFWLRKYESAFSIEMSRSVEKYLEQYHKT